MSGVLLNPESNTLQEAVSSNCACPPPIEFHPRILDLWSYYVLPAHNHLIEFPPCISQLVVVYGVLERAAHFVPFLVLLELLLLLVERAQPLVDHLQKLVNLVTLALCARVQFTRSHSCDYPLSKV